MVRWRGVASEKRSGGEEWSWSREMASAHISWKWTMFDPVDRTDWCLVLSRGRSTDAGSMANRQQSVGSVFRTVSVRVQKKDVYTRPSLDIWTRLISDGDLAE